MHHFVHLALKQCILRIWADKCDIYTMDLHITDFAHLFLTILVSSQTDGDSWLLLFLLFIIIIIIIITSLAKPAGSNIQNVNMFDPAECKVIVLYMYTVKTLGHPSPQPFF